MFSIRKRIVALLTAGIILFPFLTDRTTGHTFAAEQADETVLLFEDDASSLQAAGWSRLRPPVEGVYTIDSTHSLGNPNGIATKPVEPGQYLFYGDQTASQNAQYTSITKTLPIGSEGWRFEFSAKFADLMKPNRYPVYRGISVDLVAGGKEYKITFQNPGRILAMLNLSGDFVEQTVEFPSPDEFHQWSIAYDGLQTVTVKLDGFVVASFDEIGIPVTGRADQLVILNAPLNLESGTNEVYIDHMKLFRFAVDGTPPAESVTDRFEALTFNDYVQKDTNPATTAISFRGTTGSVALDYQNRSIGADLGSVQRLDRVQLWNRNTTSRVTSSDYAVYVSNDNLTYRLATDWSFRSRVRDNRLIHEFQFHDTETRYVKINSAYGDTAFTFVLLNPQIDMKVFVQPDPNADLRLLSHEAFRVGSLPQDVDEATGTIDNWGVSSPLQLDGQQTSVGFDFGTPTYVGKVELVGADASGQPGKLDYRLFASTDNVHYTPISYWTFDNRIENDRLVHTFLFPEGIEARYFKLQVQAVATGSITLYNPQIDTAAYSFAQQTIFALEQAPFSGTVGYLDLDASPQSGEFTHWGASDFDIDVHQRSIGFDLGTIRRIRTVQIWNSGNGPTLDSGAYSLYTSSNNLQYVPVSGWTFSELLVGGRRVQQFSLPPSIHARYVKVHVNTDEQHVAQQRIQAQTDVKVYSDPYPIELQGSVGYRTNDNSPSTGSLVEWNQVPALSLDEPYTSFGVDLGEMRHVGRVELTSSAGGSMLDASRYNIYQSDDNLYYRLVTKWTFASYESDQQDVHVIRLGNVTTRYLKITVTNPDSNETFFLGNVQQQMRVYAAPTVTALPAGITDLDQQGIEADLKTKRRVSKLEVRYPEGTAAPDLEAYTLFASDDRVLAEPITHWDALESLDDGLVVHSFEFDGVQARYVTLRVSEQGAPAPFPVEDPQEAVRLYTVTGGNVQPSEHSIDAQIGFVRNDIVPEQGQVGEWGSREPFVWDTSWNSVGADLGAVKPFNRIRLMDDDHERRLQRSDLGLYVSQDNVTYTKVEQWDLKQSDHQLELYNFQEQARYVKVHQYQNFGEPTFAALGGTLQAMMTVADEPEHLWSFAGHGQWTYKKSIAIQNEVTSAVYERAVRIGFDQLNMAALVAEGKAGASFHDVRFTDNDGRELHHYRADDAFYVRIPELAALEETTVEMYYGNPNAADVSDGLQTFQVEYGSRTITPWPMYSQSKPLQLQDGSLMEFYNNGTNIYAHRSPDSGKTWEPPILIADLGGAENMGGALQLANGDIVVLFFKLGKFDKVNCLSECLSELYVSRSTDSGATWTTPNKLDTGWNYNLTYSNPIELDNGDIIAPFHYAFTNDGAFRLSVMISTDGGITWSKSGSDIETPGSGFETGATEGAVVQLADGSLNMYYRAQTPEANRLGQSFSTDRGRTWSGYAPSALYAANTMPAIQRTDDRIYLLWAGNNAFGGTSYVRAPFNLAYSVDETNHWLAYRDLLARTPYQLTKGQVVTQPDFAIAEDDSAMIVWAHDAWGTSEGKGWSRMRIEDFEKWLTRSHGGFSGFDTADLENNYWWLFSSDIRVQNEQAFAGTGALLFADTNPSAVTEATRGFGTAISQGTVRFQLYPERLDSGFVAALKETYSRGLHAAGTAFELYAAPDGSVSYGTGDGQWTPLPQQLAVTMNDWNEVEISFDATASEVEVAINGQHSGQIVGSLSGSTINYLHLSSESAATVGTAVYVDELIVRDMHVPSPVLRFVGSEIPLQDTAPLITVEMSTADGERYENNTWTYQSVTAGVYAKDELGEVAALDYSLDGGVTWSVYERELHFDHDGIYTILVRAADEVGNEAVEQRTIKISASGLILAATLSNFDGSPDPMGGEASDQNDAVGVLVANDGSGVEQSSLVYAWTIGESMPNAAPYLIRGKMRRTGMTISVATTALAPSASKNG